MGSTALSQSMTSANWPPLTDIGDDVIHFHVRVGRQNDVGKQTIVLQPGMLGHDALHLRAAQASFGVVATVPAGRPARAYPSTSCGCARLPFRKGNWYSLNWLATEPSMAPMPLNFSGSSVCRCACTSVLGSTDSCQLAIVDSTGMRKPFADLRVKEGGASQCPPCAACQNR